MGRQLAKVGSKDALAPSRKISYRLILFVDHEPAGIVGGVYARRRDANLATRLIRPRLDSGLMVRPCAVRYADSSSASQIEAG